MGVGSSVTVLNDDIVMPRNVASGGAEGSEGGADAVMTVTGCGTLRIMWRICVERSGCMLMLEVAAPRRAEDLERGAEASSPVLAEG